MDNLRRFIVVFTLIIFVTLSICGIVLASSYLKMAHTEERSASVSAPTYDPEHPPEEANGNFQENILLIIGDNDDTETELMMIINVNASTSSLSFMYIPKDLKFAMSSDRTVDTFGNMLRIEKTPDVCTDIASSFLDVNIDYYVQMPCETFAAFIDAFDSDGSGISYTVPTDMKYVYGKYNIDLKKDTNVLHGAEALSYIQFYRTENDEYSSEMIQYYDGSDIMRIKAAQSLLAAFLEQKVIKTGAQGYAGTFVEITKPFLSTCDTNLTESELKSIGAVIGSSNANGVKYYCFNGTDQYLDKYYLVYNGMCTNLISSALIESESIIRSDFRAN